MQKYFLISFSLFAFFIQSGHAQVCDSNHQLNAEIALIQYIASYSQDGQGLKNEKLAVLEYVDWEVNEKHWYLGKGFNPSGCQLVVDASCHVKTVNSTCNF